MRLFYTVSLVIALAVTISCRRKDTPAESIVDPDAPSSLPRAAPGIAKDVDLDTSRTADRWGDPLPKGAVARIHRINPNGHGAGSRGLAFSPDGALLAFVAQDGDCRIWDIKTETELHRLPHDNPYRFPTNHNRCVFSPDGKLLIGDGGAVWEVATGRRIERFPEPPDAGIMPMAFPTLSRDGKTVAFLSHPQENACEVIIYDIASRKQIIKFGKGNRAYGPMFYSADGSVLAVVKAPESVAVPLGFPRPGAKPPALADDSAGGMVFWNPITGEKKSNWVGSHLPIGFRPDGESMWMLDSDRLTVWNLALGKPSSEPFGAWMHAGVLLPNVKELAISMHNGLSLWSAENGKMQGFIPRSTWHVNSIVHSPSGRWLATGSNDGTIFIWDVAYLRAATPVK